MALVNSIHIMLIEEIIRKTLTDHDCDLCFGTIPGQSQCRKLSGSISGQWIDGAWVHDACWDSFLASSLPTGRAQYDVFKYLRGAGLV